MVGIETCCIELQIAVGPSIANVNTTMKGRATRLPHTTSARGDCASTFFENILPAAQEKAANKVKISPTNEVPASTLVATIPMPMKDINEPMIFQRLGLSLKNMAASPIEKNT